MNKLFCKKQMLIKYLVIVPRVYDFSQKQMLIKYGYFFRRGELSARLFRTRVQVQVERPLRPRRVEV